MKTVKTLNDIIQIATIKSKIFSKNNKVSLNKVVRFNTHVKFLNEFIKQNPLDTIL
jgi:hypothetical protein